MFGVKYEKFREEEVLICEEIQRCEESCKPVQLDQQSVGRISRIDAIQSQQMALSHKIRLNDKLSAIKQAIVSIHNDPEYGVCQECGDEIPSNRLAVAPNVKLCIQCIDLQE